MAQAPGRIEFLGNHLAVPAHRFANNAGITFGVRAGGDHLDPVASRKDDRLVDVLFAETIQEIRHRRILDEKPVTKRQTAGAMIDADNEGSTGRDGTPGHDS